MLSEARKEKQKAVSSAFVDIDTYKEHDILDSQVLEDNQAPAEDNQALKDKQVLENNQDNQVLEDSNFNDMVTKNLYVLIYLFD